MADAQQLELIRQGAQAWNDWRQANPELRPNLDNADLYRKNLSEAYLKWADVRWSHLSWADLSGANLSWAGLCNADLSGADLTHADLSGADLTHADLSEADLRNANLFGANLSQITLRAVTVRGANFRSAFFDETLFVDTDLNGAIGIETCPHRGPSIIDYRTLAKSGPLPLKFLRGCGLPDTLIEYLPSLLNQPIQFYSCFISYSTKDQDFADRLHTDLQNKGVRCWFAPHDMQGGKKLHEQIDEAIRLYERLLLILSPASMDTNG